MPEAVTLRAYSLLYTFYLSHFRLLVLICIIRYINSSLENHFLSTGSNNRATSNHLLSRSNSLGEREAHPLRHTVGQVLHCLAASLDTLSKDLLRSILHSTESSICFHA